MRSAAHACFSPLGLLIAVAVCLAGSAQAAAPEYVQKILRDAKAEAVSIPGQVKALVDLAWPHETEPDPLIQAEARQSLIRYGHHVLPVLRREFPDLDPLYQGDAIAAFIEARLRNPSGTPPDFLPGLEEAIWYGSTEAQRIALNEIKNYTYPPAVLSSIDACHASPILTRYVVRSLARMGDPRARLFLTDLLLQGSDLYRGEAARALESFGESTLDNLRSGVKSDDPAARQTALRVFLPLSETGDLTLLQDYLANRTDDDPELREAVRRRVDVLERRLAP